MNECELIDKAICVMESRLKNWSEATQLLGSSDAKAFVRKYFRLKVGDKEHEEFHVIFLNSKHRLIESQCMFRGTIDGAAVYPREVAKEALRLNAAAVVLAHNHPSGETEPSVADRDLTKRISDALELFDIRVLDHMIVGGFNVLSMSEEGMM